jgi:hypothetical protein
MSEILKIVNTKMPKTVYLASSSDFPKFEEALKTLAEKYLSTSWEWTFKVGGKVHKEIEENDSENPCLRVIANIYESRHIPHTKKKYV